MMTSYHLGKILVASRLQIELEGSLRHKNVNGLESKLENL